MHAQMARELGLNPNRLGTIDNHRQQPWKLPLARHIEHLYLESFGQQRPVVVVPLEQQPDELFARAEEYT
jgi:hypothetical protein